MLRLLPKDIVNYIYNIIHKSNTQDIVNDYNRNVRSVKYLYIISLHQDNCFIWVKFKNVFIPFNHRNYYSNVTDIFRFGVKCAKIPKRYRYSLTHEEFELVSTPTSTK